MAQMDTLAPSLSHRAWLWASMAAEGLAGQGQGSAGLPRGLWEQGTQTCPGMGWAHEGHNTS